MSFATSGATEEELRSERAQRAVKAFRAMQHGLTGYVQAITGDRRITIEVSSGVPRTDGRKIYFRPPIELGDLTPHVRNLCDRRDPETLKQLCDACRIREEVLITIYHEIAHIIYGTLAEPSPADKVSAMERAIDEAGSKYAETIRKEWDKVPKWKKDDYLNLSSLISPFLPTLVNALEDARVDDSMFRARRGTKVMFDAMVKSVFANGFEANGEIVRWNEKPLNSQIIIGVFVLACKYDFRGWFHEDVERALGDKKLRQLVDRVETLRSSAGSYNLAFPILARLRELGFCRKPEEENDEPEDQPELDEPEDNEEQEDEQDSGDQSGDPGEGEKSGDGDEGDPVDDADGANDPEDSGEPGGGDADPDGSGADSEDQEGDAESGSASPEQSGDADGSDPEDGGREGGDDSEDSGDSEPGDAGSSGGSVPESGEVPDEVPDGSSGGEQDSEPSESEGKDPGEGGDGDSSTGEGSGHSDGGGSSDHAGSGGDSSSDNGDDSEQPGEDSGPEEPSDGDDEVQVEEGSEDSDERGDRSDDAAGEGDPGGESDVRAGDDSSATEATGSTPSGPGNPGQLGESEEGEDDVEESSDPQEGQEAEEGLTEDLIDTGADKGEGGVKRPEYGDAADVENDLQEFSGHDETLADYSDEARFPTADQQAVAVAVAQGEYFEKPSINVEGVREHRYGKTSYYLGRPMENGWSNAEYFDNGGADENNWKVRMGIDCDVTVPESIMSPALLQMRRAFSDNERAAFERHLRSGRINQRVLGRRAWAGDERLFQKKRLPGKRSYAVVLGIDISGSTVGRNIALAKRAAMAQAELLSRMGIDFAIYAHTAIRPRGQTMDYALDMHVIKEFNDPWNEKTQKALSKISATMENLDGHGVEYYRKIIERHPATDKIILYYSDGKMPAANYDEELEILQREIQYCKQHKITLLGVGIRTDSPQRHGLDTVQVDDDSDLVKVIQHLQSAVLHRR